jgi:cytochrome c oxidase subunit 2
VPSLFPKVDAIPGETTETSFRGQPGTYDGQCAELCGIQHAEMLATVEVLAADEFDTWLTEEARSQETGDSDLGQQIFAGVCSKCHGEKGQGLIGPGLSSSTVSNASAVEDIVRNGRGKMPAVGAGWDDRQVKALTDYLKEAFPSGG